MKSDFSGRLKDFIDSVAPSIRQFEIECGISTGTIGKVINHGTDLSKETIDKITARHPQLDVSWLMTGKKSTEATSETDIPSKWKNLSVFYKKRADRYEEILIALGIDIDSIDKPGAKD